MPPVFNQIAYFHGETPRDGALQMAIDELLLTEIDGERVILRDYVWAQATTTIGYFGEVPDPSTCTKSERVRRPTGGGLVEHGHGQDWTYSVLISAAVARGLRLAPRQSYRAIHSVLAEVLREFGIPATLASDAESGDGGQACFVNPVGDDLMLDGRKIAGAGQKRSRGAILHQGSVQPVGLPAEFGKAFAKALGREVETAALSADFIARAEVLAEKKYRSERWTHRRKFDP